MRDVPKDRVIGRAVTHVVLRVGRGEIVTVEVIQLIEGIAHIGLG